MIEPCILSAAPLAALLLDGVLVVLFVALAARSSAALRWRLVAMAAAFALTVPIELSRVVGGGGPWTGTANLAWNGAMILAVSLLVRMPWTLASILAGGSLALTLLPLAFGVPQPVVDSVSNGLLATSGFVLMGRQYLTTGGFGAGNLAATWLMFGVHGACFHLVVGGGELTLAYGFLLAVLILWCQALFGYTDLVRELDGRIVVRLPRPYAVTAAAVGTAVLLVFNLSAPALVGSGREAALGVLALVAAAGVVTPLAVARIHHGLAVARRIDGVLDLADAHRDEVARLRDEIARLRQQEGPSRASRG